MAGVITTGAHPKALWPGVKEWFGREYKKTPRTSKKIFSTEKSRKNYEEDVELTGFGLAPIKAQGAGVEYDSETQGPTTRYTHDTYALGYICTFEELQDNLYEAVSKKRSGALAFSFRETQEQVAANVLNRAHNASYAGGDGKAMLATDHPTPYGSQSNKLTVAADLSEAALESLLIQIRKARNAKGLRISLAGQSLIVPPDEKFNAVRILKSHQQAGNDFNDVNAVKSLGLLPKGIVEWEKLSSAKAWFVDTNAPRGLIHMSRMPVTFTKDNDFDTENAKAKAVCRFKYGWTDWRGMYGSEGT